VPTDVVAVQANEGGLSKKIIYTIINNNIFLPARNTWDYLNRNTSTAPMIKIIIIIIISNSIT
jgi:hypothetical protein